MEVGHDPKTSTLVLGTCMLLAPGVGGAQDADPFLVGNRVRVTLDSSSAAVKGRVLASDRDTLTLLAGDQPLKVSKSRITGAETSIGRRSAWLKGAAIGAGLGMLLGVALPVDTTMQRRPGLATPRAGSTHAVKASRSGPWAPRCPSHSETMSTLLRDRKPLRCPDSQKGFFYRSDQFSFARKGVRAAYFDAGTEVLGKPE
jgi:hypothetical protein